MVTLESVNAWKWITDEDHKGEIPAMPKEERIALADLSNIDPAKYTPEQKALYKALMKKLIYLAEREINTEGF